MTDRIREDVVSKAELLGNPRYDKHGKISLMAGAEGYVMVRRPGSVPWIMTSKEWEALPIGIAVSDADEPVDKTSV